MHTKKLVFLLALAPLVWTTNIRPPSARIARLPQPDSSTTVANLNLSQKAKSWLMKHVGEGFVHPKPHPGLLAQSELSAGKG